MYLYIYAITFCFQVTGKCNYQKYMYLYINIYIYIYINRQFLRQYISFIQLLYTLRWIDFQLLYEIVSILVAKVVYL